MKCLLSGNNVKVLARAIHSLAKIGDELHIEPSEEGMILKTVNSSKSAFASFTFHIPFFLTYSHISENTLHPGSSDEPVVVVKCKLPMKSILSVFRSIGSLEKTVETCKISLPLLEALLIIEFKCKYGITKHFNLRYFECESVEAEFSKDGYASNFACSSRFYSEALQSFHNSIPEVTWSLAADQVHLSNYIDDEIDPTKCVRTEVTLAKEEFEEFSVALCTQITFCLKELKAILFFAEPQSLDLHCRMEEAGKPVLFSLSKDNLYSADFLLATLTPAVDSSATPSTSGRNATQRATPSNLQQSPSGSVLRNQSGANERSLSRPAMENSLLQRSRIPPDTSRPCSTMLAANSPEHCSRLNSLSLLEPHPILPMDTDFEAEVTPPPAKRIRARYIFQRCLKPIQEGKGVLGELYAADSDGEGQQ